MTYEEAVDWLYTHAMSPGADDVLAVLEREHEEAERLRWLCKDGTDRRWTFWLGTNTPNGDLVWPCFGGEDIREAIDAARGKK